MWLSKVELRKENNHGGKSWQKLKRKEYNHGGGGSRGLWCPWLQSGWRVGHLWAQGAWHHQSHHFCKLIALTIIKHSIESKIKSWLEVRVWDSSSNAMDQLPAQVFYKQLHPCILQESTLCMHVCMYTRISKSSTATSNLCCSLRPQLAHEREEAESGGLLVIKDCFNVDRTRATTAWMT